MALSRWEKIARSDVAAGAFAVAVVGGAFLLFGLKGLAWLSLIVVGGAFLLPLAIMAMFAIPDLRDWFIGRRVRIDSKRFDRFLDEQIKVLRPLGFFEDDADLTDRKFKTKLKRRIRAKWGKHVGQIVKYPVRLAALDRQRVFFDERDIWPSEDEYLDLFEGLPRVSRGAFQPSNIRDAWTEEEAGSHLTVEFELDGRKCSVECPFGDRERDPYSFAEINPFIEDTGFAFRAARAGGDYYAVVCLTEDEWNTLEKLGWWEQPRKGNQGPPDSRPE